MNISFQNRIVLFFSALFLSVQILTMLFVYRVSHDNVIKQIGQNLVYAEQFFGMALTERGKRIASEARILVADFGFRTTINDGDQKTITSALENLALRIHGHRAFYLDLKGKIIADTKGVHQGTGFMFPDSLHEVDRLGKSVVFGILDGELYELALVSVLAPIPIGYVVVATTVDNSSIDQYKHLSALALDISILEKSDGQARILTSSLPTAMQHLLADKSIVLLKSESNGLEKTLLGDTAFISRLQFLPSATKQQTLFAVLQVDFAQAMAPYWLIFYAALALLAFALLATVAGSIFIAKMVSKPVRALASASEQIMNGEFDQRLPITGHDELGRLAETFNRAAVLATQMGELKQKDQLRREMVATVSHDLRTPLTSLHGYLETMHRKAHSLPVLEQQHFLEVALRQSEKISRLAQELFELAKLECDETCLNLEDFSLAELLQDITHKFQLYARQKNLNLTAELRLGLPPVRGDIGLIERLLTNLIDNAIRHTGSGGMVRIDACLSGNKIMVSVTDNGVGIAPAYLPTLFDWESPLAKKARTEAGGFGLVIVAKIVSLHGGAVQVESILGQGSVFRFDLPIASPGS